MNISKNIKFLILILFLALIISIFFIPELISIFKKKQRIYQLKSDMDNYNKQKAEIHQKLEEIKNNSEILYKSKDEIIYQLKEIVKINSYYGEEIDEGETDIYIIERKNDIMKELIKLYENNSISSYNLINNMFNYFQNHTLEDYYNNISNILMVSTIIKNELDIDFIYNEIIHNFFDVNNKKDKKYILGSPCFKSGIDSNDPYIFHKKCDKYGYTIMFIKTNQTRFGGITDLYWGKSYYEEKEYNKTKTRLFNLDNQKIFIYDKNQKISRHIPPIRGDNYIFAIFGYNDIFLGYLPRDSCSDFPKLFLKPNDTNIRFNDLLNQDISPFLDNVKFEYQDIEVYPILIIDENK